MTAINPRLASIIPMEFASSFPVTIKEYGP